MAAEKKVQMWVSVLPSLKKRLEKIADGEQRPLSTMCSIALDEWAQTRESVNGGKK